MNSAQELEDEIRLFEGSKAAREVFGAVQEYMKTDFGSTPLEEAVHKIAEAKAALSRVGEVRKWHKRLAGKTRGGEIGGYVLSRAGEQLRAAEGLEGMVNEEAGRLFTRVKSGFRSHYNHFPNAAGEAGAGCRARLEAYAELHEQLAQQFNTKDGLLARYYAFAKDMEPIDDALGKAKAEYANTQFDQHTLLILRNSLQGILQAYSATTAAYKPFGIFPRKTPFDYSEKVAEARALAEETEFALKNCAALQHVTGLQRELSSEPASAQEAERRLGNIPRYRAEANSLLSTAPNSSITATRLKNTLSYLAQKGNEYGTISKAYRARQQLAADCQALERIAYDAHRLAEAAREKDVERESAQIGSQLDAIAARTYASLDNGKKAMERRASLIGDARQYLQEAQGYMQMRAEEQAAEQARGQARMAEEQRRRETEKEAEQARAVAEAENIVRQHGTFTAFLSSLKPRNPAYYGLLESLRDPTRSWAECLERMGKRLSAIGPVSCGEDIGFIEQLSRGLRKASEDTSYSYLAQKVSESQKCRAFAESALSALAMYVSSSRAALATPAMPAAAPS